jgi:hypothetical protein
MKNYQLLITVFDKFGKCIQSHQTKWRVNSLDWLDLKKDLQLATKSKKAVRMTIDIVLPLK